LSNKNALPKIKFSIYGKQLNMSKFKIVNLFDKIFITIAIFLVSFAWVNFYIRSLWVTFVFSLIFTFACVFVLYYFLNKKNAKKELNLKEKDNINKNYYIFRLTPHCERLKLLKKVLEKFYSCELKHNILTYEKENKTHLVILATNLDTLTQNDLLSLLDEFLDVKTDVIDIVCNENKTINTDIFTNKKIEIINKSTLYNLFKLAEIYPEAKNLNLKSNKIHLKDIILSMFTPRKAKSYFLCGLVLIFSSIILPYNVYYIIVGSMLLLFSVICKLIPLFKD